MNKQWLLNLLVFPLVVAAGCQAAPRFSSERAFAFLKAQCAFGPRVPGTAAHLECRDYLVAELKKTTPHVTVQAFGYHVRNRRQTGYNLIARWQPQNPRRLLLCAHWDTRPWADEDPDPANHLKPVLGANDGASGVAVLLHLAELFAQQPPTVGIDIVLFDAEDSGDHANNATWALGSAAFAREYARPFSPRFGILLDMIGDAELEIYQEAYSYQYARDIVERVWHKAAELGIGAFVPQVGYAVYDDHIALLQAGIPCIDIIDFDYRYWHTVNDTPDKCSPLSLEKVGRVVSAVVYEEK